MSEFQIYSSSNSLHRAGRELSPRHYDVDFYRRKSDRLEEQLLTLTDQLNKARLRLRKAQDFEIKCELLYKQNLQLEENAVKRDKQLFELRSNCQQMQLRLEERGFKNEESTTDKERMLKEIEIWKEKSVDAEERCKLAIVEQQTRADERLKKEVATAKRNFQEKEKQYKYEIERMKRELRDRMSIDTNSQEKVDKIKRQKEEEIRRLQNLVANNRQDYLAMVSQKNQQLLIEKVHFETLMNEGLGKLKNNLSHQDEKFKGELSALASVIKVKNQEIAKLQNQFQSLVENNAKEREELNRQIRLFKNKIYEIQIAHDQELFNLKQRLTTLHSIDIDNSQKHYEGLLEAIREERRELQQLLSEKDKTLKEDSIRADREKKEMSQIISDRDRTINELTTKFSSSQTANHSEATRLQQALDAVASEKQLLTNEYQSNVTFLNQQITKLTLSNELKNNQIRELHQYIAVLKREQFEQIRQLENKWKQQRKERETERQKERDLREKVEEDLREQEKNWKNRERELEKESQREKRQKAKLAMSLQNVQKEVQRLFKQNIALEQRCKKEQGKNQRNVMSGGGAKRQLENELIRQRAQLEGLKRLQVDQLKKELELELTRLRNANQRLQSELTSKKIEFDNLETEFRKVSSQYKNIDKINKEKLVDYQKKISTLNSQILLTQNLYQNLVGAKSKVQKQEYQ